jgi:hypothetical protein
MNDRKKLTVVINGKGGVGKDTLCDAAALHFSTRNISSITPIKEIARTFGWNGEKDLRSRRFLAELKRVFSEYNDLPNRYLIEQHQAFLESDEQLLFVHIREADQIKAFVQGVGGACVTLLVRRDLPETATGYGNHADDDVEDYSYDCIFDNNRPLEQAQEAFIEFIKALM